MITTIKGVIFLCDDDKYGEVDFIVE